MFKSIIIATGLALSVLALSIDRVGSERPERDEKSHLEWDSGFPVGPYL